MLKFLAAVIVGLVVFSADAAQAESGSRIAGQVKVIDGDTLEVHQADGRRVRVRLAGIDAPELRQVCERDGSAWLAGAEAKAWLADVLRGRPVECVTDGTRSYNRFVADCWTDGRNLQELIVAAGWAVRNKFSGGRFVEAQDRAKVAGVGVHGGRCDAPWVWRRRK